MKSKGPLTLAVVVSLFAVDALIGADAAKKPAAAAKAAKGEKTAAKSDAAKSDAEIPETVAVVEGTEIKKAELETALNAVLAQQSRNPADIPPEQKPMVYRMVLDDLIIDKLIAKRSAELKVEDSEVDAMVSRLKKNFGSEEEFKGQVEKMGQTLDKVKDNIRTNLRQQHWVEEQVKGKAAVTDAEAEDFYKKNTEQFKQPEQVRASHILVAVPQDAKPEIVVEKEKTAKAVLERVKKGEAFDKLAKEISEDPSAKENSGDLSYFAREQMVPEFAEAAFKMKQDEVSAEPVRSQFGYHIIKVTGHKDAETVPFEKAKPQLVAYLENQKKQQEIEKVVKEMRAKADITVNLPEAPIPTPPPASDAPKAAPKK
jgi:peptidyl-prolyl cis-trans isomerase C